MEKVGLSPGPGPGESEKGGGGAALQLGAQVFFPISGTLHHPVTSSPGVGCAPTPKPSQREDLETPRVCPHGTASDNTPGSVT